MEKLAQYRRPYWDTQPEYRFDPYASTQLRSPAQPPVALPQTLSEVTGPAYGAEFVRAGDNDLTAGHAGEPFGERIPGQRGVCLTRTVVRYPTR